MSKKNPQDDPRPRIATLSSFQTAHSSGSEDNEESMEPQNFFVGGGKNSGLVVEDPTANDIIHRIMEKAKEGENARVSSRHPMSGPFGGQGFSLSAASSRPSAQNEAQEQEQDVAIREVTFWRNGFSIDEQPLRNYADPANQRLLKAILSGHAPLDELNVRMGQPVELRMAHRTNEDYSPPPKKPLKPFEGTGQRLGAVVTSSLDSSNNNNNKSHLQTANAKPDQEGSKSLSTLDRNAPITQIQIRLANGQRLVGDFNLTQTVGDIRQYIRQNAPNEMTQRPFALQTMLPVQSLNDDSATIEAAGLAHSSLVLRPL